MIQQNPAWTAIHSALHAAQVYQCVTPALLDTSHKLLTVCQPAQMETTMILAQTVASLATTLVQNA